MMREFQWAPTLEGECYFWGLALFWEWAYYLTFQWAPTLEGECYQAEYTSGNRCTRAVSMGTHP